tara:strand:- start:564 stop:947 length:384 start_codon:yes stop_codon:yes gene_type:complete
MKNLATYTPRETTAMTIKALKKEFGLKSHSLKVWDATFSNGKTLWESTRYNFTLGDIYVSFTLDRDNCVTVSTGIGNYANGNIRKRHQGRYANLGVSNAKVIKATRARDLAKRVSKDIKKLQAMEVA